MKYLGYYAEGARLQESNCSLAAVNKMSYISDVIVSITGRAEIISRAVKNNAVQKKEIIDIGNGKTVQYFKYHPWIKFIDVLIRPFYKLKFIAWMLNNIKTEDTAIVYHSLGYMSEMNLAHRLKKFRMILEVEEIYSDVIGDERLHRKELSFVRSADGYIFPTKMLSKLVNINKKPEVFIHGTYQIEPDRKQSIFETHNTSKGSERMVHCVYAGTLDPRKGGAVAAVSAAEYLPANYHIHILGFGSDEEIQRMKDLIEKISKKSKAKVSYDGLLSGEDYIRFIQSCNIGLSTQDPSAAFNGTSFPSKILSYMANGLRVVSVRIPAVETSKVGNDLVYYDQQTPEEIANAILKVDLNQVYDSRIRVQQLAEQFRTDLSELLSEEA